MDDAAAAVHIIQPKQYLLRDLLHEVHRHALVLVALDEPEQILAQHLEHHADVRPVRALVPEVVQERDHVRPPRVRLRGGRQRGRVRVLGGGQDGGGRGGGRDEPLEELDLVQRGFGVSGRGLDDFEGDVPVQPVKVKK